MDTLNSCGTSKTRGWKRSAAPAFAYAAAMLASARSMLSTGKSSSNRPCITISGRGHVSVVTSGRSISWNMPGM
jgi:hypothetical protein